MSFEYEPLAVFIRNSSIGEVVTAIESDGCHGYDRFGRFKTVDNLSDLLVMLADFHEKSCEWQEKKLEEAKKATSRDEYDFHVEQAFANDPLDTPCEFFAWKYGWPVDKVPSRLKKFLPSQETSTTVVKAIQGWMSQCQQIADEFEEADIRAQAYSSLTDMAKRVEVEAEKRGIRGANGGILSNGYILRNALQSGQWIRKQTKLPR